MPLPFEQQPRESTKAFAAFSLYLSLGAERSTAAVAKELAKSEQLVRRWSAKFGWTDRVAAHGAHLAVVERQAIEAAARSKAAEWESREQKLRETEWAMHEAAIAAAKKGLVAYMEKDKVYANLADIARMLEIASKLGRLATGLGTEGERRGDDLPGLRVEVTVALEKIYSEPIPGEIVDVEVVPGVAGKIMTPWERYFLAGRRAGCPKGQMDRFASADVILQARQLAASAAARMCDAPTGPMAIGYGGARGGGKSHWLLAQMGADDCQRVPGLKCLLLRKVGKANLEHFEDLRRRLFGRLNHEFSAFRGILTFPKNGSRIIAGHFQNEKDIDAYLGLEYDVIGIEEATTLTARKYQDISTCCRTSKSNFRPRIYSTTNPGGVGHGWYRTKFIVPFQENRETETRFIPARVTDNKWNNPEYVRVLENLTGWQKRAWLDGDWDIAAGQYFTTLRREVHVVEDFDDTRAREWFAALDYGFAHYTVVLLGCTDGDGNLFVVDEHAERLWLPQRHATAIKAMLARHKIGDRKMELSDLKRFVAGADVFSRQSDGTTIAAQYAKLGINLRCANTDRINGWAEIMNRFGDVEAKIRPTLFIHKRCGRLIETLPALQHDPNRPEDVLKIDADEDGIGGDDAADALRYLVATKARAVTQRKLRGL